MNDYKEMIEYLRATANEMTAADVHAFGVDDDVVVESEDAGMLRNAADAIEQLVKERDAAVADLKQHVYESGECFACRHYIWETDRCDRSDEAAEPDEDTCWEWCGVREDNDEID